MPTFHLVGMWCANLLVLLDFKHLTWFCANISFSGHVMHQLVGVVGLQTSHVILCDFERTVASIHASYGYGFSWVLARAATTLCQRHLGMPPLQLPATKLCKGSGSKRENHDLLLHDRYEHGQVAYWHAMTIYHTLWHWGRTNDWPWVCPGYTGSYATGQCLDKLCLRAPGQTSWCQQLESPIPLGDTYLMHMRWVLVLTQRQWQESVISLHSTVWHPEQVIQL